jgi:hypothetical protein
MVSHEIDRRFMERRVFNSCGDTSLQETVGLALDPSQRPPEQVIAEVLSHQFLKHQRL